jgi:Tol biopolymer transport system component
MAGVGRAEAPPGPRLALERFNRHGDEIITTDPTGASVSVIAGGGPDVRPLPTFLSPTSWLPSGAALAFSGAHGNPSKSVGSDAESLYLAPAGGGEARKIPATDAGMQPVVSPDGASVAFLRFRGVASSTKGHRVFSHSAIWIAALDGSGARRLTPWNRGAVDFPYSFSPDGPSLAITREGAKGGVMSIDLRTRRVTMIASGAGEPAYSPDGSRIAYVRGSGKSTDIYVADADGRNAKRVTATAAFETSPTWDPSGQRLAYLRLAPLKVEAAEIGLDDSVMEVNADGTCSTKVLSKRGTAFLSPRWQPGSGREARPISC